MQSHSYEKYPTRYKEHRTAGRIFKAKHPIHINKTSHGRDDECIHETSIDPITGGLLTAIPSRVLSLEETE